MAEPFNKWLNTNNSLKAENSPEKKQQQKKTLTLGKGWVEVVEQIHNVTHSRKSLTHSQAEHISEKSNARVHQCEMLPSWFEKKRQRRRKQVQPMVRPSQGFFQFPSWVIGS